MTEKIYPKIHKVDSLLREISRSTFLLRDEVERGYNSIEDHDAEIIANCQAEINKMRNALQDAISYFVENPTQTNLENPAD